MMMTAQVAGHPGPPPSEFPSPRLFKKRGDPGGNHGHELKEEEEAKRYAAADDEDDDDIDDRSATSSQQPVVAPPYLPTQVELALLCLDHLRDVRRYMAATDKLTNSEGKENRGKKQTLNDNDEKKDGDGRGPAAFDDEDDDGRRAEEEGRSGQEDDENEDDFGNLHARMNPHYLTIAVWALQRAFQQPTLSVSNDPYTDLVLDNKRSSSSSSLPPPKKLPSLRDMEGEVLVLANGGDEGNAASPYEYDDHHASNVHRFYRNHGLNSGGTTTNDESGNIGGGPLLLGELVAAGLSSLEAGSRRAAEQELCQSILFQQFVSAVTERGFFDTPVTPTVGAAANKSALTSSSSDNSHYQEKFQKVIAKFRTKLAGQSNDPGKHAFTGDWLALTAAEQYGHHVRRQNVQRHQPQQQRGSSATQPKQQRTHETQPETGSAVPSASRFPSSLKLSIEAPSPVLPESLPKMFFVDGPSPLSAAPSSNGPTTSKFGHYSASTKPSSMAPSTDTNAPAAANGPRSETATKRDEDNANDASLQAAAEALKNQGNVHMQQREFELAADCYTKAIQLCPSGPSSHVYYSNRAAALVSIRQFHLAIADSQRSLALKPDYGKAHARLGLAHFLLGQYELAVHAYSESLRHEPDNRSSRNYLDKATRRLADQREQQKSSPGAAQQQQQQSLSSHQSAMGTSSVGPKVPQAGRLDPAGVANKSQTPPPPPPRDASRSRSEQPRHDGTRSAPSPSAGSAQQQQAEKCKAKGNQFMVQRDYSSAYDAYTRAIELSPDGPQSHVYYSNRAAALCYLERYREAERDSLCSLRLVPGYGKAHARLGLSRFFVGDYEGAVSSYQLALEHDPNNAASKSYLLKAQGKLQQQQQQQQRGKE
jgi:tetratricopeptide (TPR) repeat protein